MPVTREDIAAINSLIDAVDKDSNTIDPRIVGARQALARIAVSMTECCIAVIYPPQHSYEGHPAFEVARDIARSLQQGKEVTIPRNCGWEIKELPRPYHVLLSSSENDGDARELLQTDPRN